MIHSVNSFENSSIKQKHWSLVSYNKNITEEKSVKKPLNLQLTTQEKATI